MLKLSSELLSKEYKVNFDEQLLAVIAALLPYFQFL